MFVAFRSTSSVTGADQHKLNLRTAIQMHPLTVTHNAFPIQCGTPSTQA